MLILAALPILSFAVAYLVLRSLWPDQDWRLSFLRVALVWGGYLTLSTELLSLVEGISLLALCMVWAMPILLGGIWLSRRARPRSRLTITVPEAWADRLLLGCIAAILVITGIVAWKTPPQTPDSMNYHMSRVAHWAQNRSVAHFATGIGQQNSRPPGAEYAILHFYVLTGGDRPATFVQWGAMLGSLVGVSLIAAQSGAERRGQILASLFLATLPLGIVEASSTINDYVVAFWMVCATAELLLILRSPRPPWPALVMIGLAAGLGVLTKPTAFPYLAPMALFLTIDLVRRANWSVLVRAGALAIMLVLALNAGYLVRNVRTFGALLNPSQIKVHSNQRRDFHGLVSNALRNAGLQAGTPWPTFNRQLSRAIFAVHFKMGMDPNDPRTTAHGEFWVRTPSRHEDLTINPAHAWLILPVLIGVWIRFRKRPQLVLVLSLVAVMSFLLLSVVFKWQIFGSRYLLPFFALCAPIFGWAFTRGLQGKLAVPIGLGLVFLSWPWLTSITSRPLFPSAGSHLESVLVASRTDLLFAHSPEAGQTYAALTEPIRSANCSQVGLMLSGAGSEYPFWVLMGAPRGDLTLEWIVAGPTSRYARAQFRPCAVICQTCGPEIDEIRGLSPVFEMGGMRLFMDK